MEESIFKDAPKFISQRFSAINRYVWNSFFPDNTLNKELRKIESDTKRKRELRRLKDIINEASIVIFIFLLKKFFVEGSEAAIKAVDTFKDLGIEDGFQIGSKHFEGRNENVMQGYMLAKSLLDNIEDPELIDLINNSNYITQIINRYHKIIYPKK